MGYSGRDGLALHLVFDGEDADIVLHPWAQVLEGAVGLVGPHVLLQSVPTLPIGRVACHSITGDVCGRETTKMRQRKGYTEGKGGKR